MYNLFTILIVVAAVFLTLLVLIQNSKGGGLAAGFASANQVFGVRKTTDKIEKATWTLVAVIVVLSIFASGIHRSDTGTQSTSELSQDVVTESATQQQQQVPSTLNFEEGLPAQPSPQSQPDQNPE
ncbi:MAG: preprotein translocase subunit SecG [Prevotellaceae bacterium]|jgi:preprotein translocase subunit SecG|nr:preprotein translocase subunit SecG [Prevotellaceae bacterium]